jgi:hypothetical protein
VHRQSILLNNQRDAALSSRIYSSLQGYSPCFGCFMRASSGVQFSVFFSISILSNIIHFFVQSLTALSMQSQHLHFFYINKKIYIYTYIYIHIYIYVYSVCHNCRLILFLFYYWLLVSASKDHHQASNYKKLKNSGAYSTKNVKFFGLHLHNINKV